LQADNLPRFLSTGPDLLDGEISAKEAPGPGAALIVTLPVREGHRTGYRMEGEK
jgi:hypothetical protein